MKTALKVYFVLALAIPSSMISYGAWKTAKYNSLVKENCEAKLDLEVTIDRFLGDHGMPTWLGNQEAKNKEVAVCVANRGRLE